MTVDRDHAVVRLENSLVRAAQEATQHLPPADVDAAVEAGMLALATQAARAAAGEADPSPEEAAHAAAADVARSAGAARRGGPPSTATTALDWSEFGTVVPVVAGSPGAGASMLAVLLVDALQLAQRRVLLIDPADPARSGLASAARSEGPWVTHPHPGVGIRYSWRAQALVARLETTLPIIAPSMVPAPAAWRPPTTPFDVTVVDLGHDPWRITAHPLSGAGSWLRRGTPHPRPVLVVRPSRPSLLHAEQVLARLDPWVSTAAVTAPAQLVVMGAKRWPPGVAGSAGRRVHDLLPRAVFIPHDAALAASGVTSAVTPSQLRRPVLPLLRSWGLLPESAGRATRPRTKERP
ncbi:hypothetical protein [Actinokineospora iranica]|uniref:MinD-like ATPase involved in chromosome partitioning or flagellar assembly n=1 Tax=Actinokineospora iranica TaxID=1271860 RepID=A0A1G6VSK5_9PSEU|nr:hypothetical protein [Actinokineospora iranica]SDD56558.1 hypothetical protein SAMN05216174_11373 [Actinokineospora iranica]